MGLKWSYFEVYYGDVPTVIWTKIMRYIDNKTLVRGYLVGRDVFGAAWEDIFCFLNMRSIHSVLAKNDESR